MLTPTDLPVYNLRMNKKALKAAQETLDKEYAKLDRAYLRTINMIGKIIDEEVRKLVDQAYQRTIDLLTEKKAEVEKIALALLDREVLHQQDVEDLIGKRPFSEKKILADDSSTPEDISTAPTE